MSYPRQAFLALPFTRLELPGWGRIARAFGAVIPAGATDWEGAPTKTIRGKAHGYLMELDLQDWAERMTYFLGRYYELTLQKAIEETLEAGDRFVDVGGNIGMISLLGARAVGPTGRVDTFEPNPTCLKRLHRVIELNELDWIDLHPFGLSDKREHLTLTVSDEHTGVGTFAPMDSSEHNVTDRIELELLRGDTRLLQNEQPVKLLKLDVEGFELNALRGLRGVLERDHPTLITELIEEQLRRAGASSAEVFDFLQGLGYRAHGMGLRRTLLGQELALTKIKNSDEAGSFNDVLWIASEAHAMPSTRIAA